MKDRIPYLNEIYRAFKSDDVKARLKHFDLLTNSLFTLTESLFENKVQIEYHHAEMENKFFRYGMANHSIKKLLEGNNFSIINKQIEIIDLFSVFALTRMQIETFAIMYYLFFEKVETIEKDFRYDLYKLHGLQKQNNFPVKFEKNEEKKKAIQKEITLVIEKVKIYSRFKNSTAKQQKEFLNPKFSKTESTKDILIKSGIDSNRMNDMWSLYSNHAHNEHISDRQYNYMYKNKKSTLAESMTVLSLNTILTSTLCKLIADEFEGVKKKYEDLHLRDKVQIETWSNLKYK
ncbi:hypothetical protein LB467_03475 [Salegentibacter sp. JZCK2]|uniref:hypothetical protein n=1 Tax=Salegentibacter tibetensis TaxID=2873600 RepID=UPI001CCDED91|nr:hypothetical protein [Salegentibacter tibetensis]MBZ9728736.1 hypothetical protein [Salegentibacter tibetensis]